MKRGWGFEPWQASCLAGDRTSGQDFPVRRDPDRPREGLGREEAGRVCRQQSEARDSGQVSQEWPGLS